MWSNFDQFSEIQYHIATIYVVMFEWKNFQQMAVRDFETRTSKNHAGAANIIQCIIIIV